MSVTRVAFTNENFAMLLYCSGPVGGLPLLLELLSHPLSALTPVSCSFISHHLSTAPPAVSLGLSVWRLSVLARLLILLGLGGMGGWGHCYILGSVLPSQHWRVLGSCRLGCPRADLKPLFLEGR